MMKLDASRREVLKRTLGIALVGTFGSRLTAGFAATSSSSPITLNDGKATICNSVGGDCGGAQRITLMVPQTVKADATMAVSVQVENSVHADNAIDTKQHDIQSNALSNEPYVVSLIVLADLHQEPEIETFKFSSGGENRVVSTRTNLARTQNIVAVAKLNDGSYISDSKLVRVLAA